MAKKIFGFFLISFFALVISTTYVSAHHAEFHATNPAKLKNSIDAKKSEIKNKAASAEARLSQKAMEKIQDVYVRTAHRLADTIERLDKIAARIESRIAKLKARGVNTSRAEAALLVAREKGEIAKNAVEEALNQLASPSLESTPKAQVQSSKKAAGAAKKALFEYHKALVLTLRELKASNRLREATQSGF